MLEKARLWVWSKHEYLKSLWPQRMHKLFSWYGSNFIHINQRYIFHDGKFKRERKKKILSRKVGFKIYVETKLAEELNLKCKQNCVRKLGLFDYNIVPTYMIWTYIYVIVLTGVYCMVYNILLFFFTSKEVS